MNNHLSPALLNALADGELSVEEQTHVDEHLRGCPACTSAALSQTLLKSATAKAGQRYVMPPHLVGLIRRDVAEQTSVPKAFTSFFAPRAPGRFAILGWATAVMLLLASLGGFFIERKVQRAAMVSSAEASVVTEVLDQHIATLAANAPPHIRSSDNHTVKPWFQGKLPFSFNLPEGLPEDTTLDGANLTYLHNQPAAQLLYDIGRHRVSVYIFTGTNSSQTARLLTEHHGFHVFTFRTGVLQAIAVSDVNATRLLGLMRAIEEAQMQSR